MPTRTGTASQVDALAVSGSTSVTVPADATAAVALWAWFDWDAAAQTFLSTLTLGGNSFTTRAEFGGAINKDGCGVATLFTLPGTGSQTLAWGYSGGGDRAEGGKIIVVWIKDHYAADPWRDAQVLATIAGADCAVTVNSDPTDLILASVGEEGAAPVLDGTLFINNAVYNIFTYDASEVTPSGGATTTVTMTGEDYPGMAAISLKAAPVGTQNQLAWIRA